MGSAASAATKPPTLLNTLAKKRSFRDMFSSSVKHLNIQGEKQMQGMAENMSLNLLDLQTTLCPIGQVKTFRLNVEGSNDCYVGAATRDLDLNCRQYPSLSIELYSTSCSLSQRVTSWKL